MSYRILIIEDYPDTAETTAALLTWAGYEVRTVATGAAGLEAARDFQPRVILCDIGLPRMSGYDVARALRQEPLLARVYLIAVTGYGRTEDQHAALAAGFHLHLTKPVDFEELRRVLKGVSPQ
jgi:CheY-like chemotaxis protein